MSSLDANLSCNLLPLEFNKLHLSNTIGVGDPPVSLQLLHTKPWLPNGMWLTLRKKAQAWLPC